VALCFETLDARLAECPPSLGLASFLLQAPRPEATPASNPTRAANAAAVIQAMQRLTPVAPGGRHGNLFTFDPPLVVSAPDNCTATAEIVVPLEGFDQRKEKLRARASGAPPPEQSRGPVDRDSLRLVCVRP
jgi:hypothetical protein